MRHVMAMGCAAMLMAGGAAAQSQNAKQDHDTKQVTVTGCLSVNPAARTYILTAKPPEVAREGGAVANAPTTIEYRLVGGNGLQQHVGETLEVTGTTDDDTAATAKSVSEHSGPPPNSQKTDKTPKIETKTKTKIRAQVMQVQSFRTVKAGCEPTALR